jgi:kynurenine formamidase
MKPVRRAFDLSDPIYNGMKGWPDGSGFSIKFLDRVEKSGFSMSMAPQMGMHTGTHVDAPLHFVVGGKSIDKYPVDRFIGEGVIVDLRTREEGQEITETDLRAFDDEIKENKMIMLCTDWSRTKGASGDYPFNWPYLGIPACRFLVSKKIKAVGTEGPSIAGWYEKVKGQRFSKYPPGEIHRLLLENDILVVENLFNLSQMLGNERVARGLFFLVPLNFIGTEASPCRAIALVDEGEGSGNQGG